MEGSGYREGVKGDKWFAYEGYEFRETGRQEYGRNNCIFAAGRVEGHSIDTHYIWIEKDGEEPIVLLLLPDEVAAIAWVTSGALWSTLIGERTYEEDGKDVSQVQEADEQVQV